MAQAERIQFLAKSYPSQDTTKKLSTSHEMSINIQNHSIWTIHSFRLVNSFTQVAKIYPLIDELYLLPQIENTPHSQPFSLSKLDKLSEQRIRYTYKRNPNHSCMVLWKSSFSHKNITMTLKLLFLIEFPRIFLADTIFSLAWNGKFHANIIEEKPIKITRNRCY